MLLICFFEIVHVDHSLLSLSLIVSEFKCNFRINNIANLIFYIWNYTKTRASHGLESSNNNKIEKEKNQEISLHKFRKTQRRETNHFTNPALGF